jgi:hypothetical protein
MERIIISVMPEKIEAVKGAIRAKLTDDSTMETAIVILGPSDESIELSLLAMRNGASYFIRT